MSGAVVCGARDRLPKTGRGLGAVFVAVLAVGAGALGTATAFAQAPRDPFACAEIAEDAARLACYDRVFAPESTQRSTPSPDAGRAPAEVPRGAAAPAGQSARDEPAAAEGSRRGGSEDRDEDDEPATTRITVVEVRQGEPNTAIFVADDGTVWQQTDGRRLALPETPFAAEIRPGALGSFFLMPAEGGRQIRVRRR